VAVGAQVLELHDRLLHWLREVALPVWETHGVDRTLGGYFETLAAGSGGGAYRPHGPIRRGRVVARQMFVFDAGRRLGWQAVQADPVRHGCDFLFARLRRDDGLFHVAIEAQPPGPPGAADPGAAAATFDLYEYAFYLFALARVHAEHSSAYPTRETASTCLELLREGWGKSLGGFEESRPPSLPLRSNPHMHLFEAALAWIDATEDAPASQAQWLQLATELCDLSLTRFIDPHSGALREFFDHDWRPMPGDSGRIVEPGHQFEWAWLFMQWAGVLQCPDAQRQACLQAASTLVDLAEAHGVDPIRDVAINELWDDMTPKDAAAKLWPQTERVKAWCALLARAQSATEIQRARDTLSRSLTTLLRYLDGEAAGLWHEVLLPDGRFTREPSKASSFYHIVGAIETLDQCVSELHTAM
jgi:mannose-6-phosphate isomerase